MAVKTQERHLVDQLLERIGEAVGQRAQAATIFGEPVEREGLTVIPVAKAVFGFGGGGGSGPAESHGGSGGGGGGGGAVSPIGYIELREGEARFRRISTAADLVGFAAAASLVALTLKRLLG